ncbi:hypothetical protein [Pedobacter africanus]|uniref:Uncharacterized protein n=1 Tax=Pedobacter africanus TaxID=151894 RepID=A0A1W2DXW8_9SPHI|nr:hypothetical protein [Pedobacter africanus]SMD02157.1 hypothetical protein SAMN04488524_4218 [Pedobacter africanus]
MAIQLTYFDLKLFCFECKTELTMKKNDLNKGKFAGAAALSRTELKKVLGGNAALFAQCSIPCRCPEGFTTRAGHQAFYINADCNGENAACLAVDYGYLRCMNSDNDVTLHCSDVYPPIEVCYPNPIT